MSAPKAGTYVLTATVFHRSEGEGDEKRRVRYKRGDRVELSKAEAARLAVPVTIGKRVVPAAFAPLSQAGDVPPGDDLATGTPVVTTDPVDPVAQALAELGVDENGGSEGSGDDDGQEATDDRVPARSANLPVWQAYAVKVGAVTEEQAAEMTKAQLKQAVADKAAE